MCGRYTRNAAWRIIAQYLKMPIIEEFSDIRIEPSMDCRPGSLQPVVRLNDDGEREMVLMRWGFKLSIQGKMKLVFNTKSEGVMTSRLWKKRFEQARCLVPASAFLEWENKVKTAISIQGQEFIIMAGLWGDWTNPTTKEVEPTFSIFTTEPNAAMQSIHNRQPVILDPAEYDEWLAPAERAPEHLLRIFPEEGTVIAPAE
jgi:putative SOS response-associated peptidase YedK